MSHGASLKRTTDGKGASTKGASRSTFSAAPLAQTSADPLDPSQLDLSVIGWGNIEMKFNELKGLLSAPASGLNANQARAQQKKRVSAAIVHLLDRAQQDCRRLLIEGNAKAAVEAGLKTLHLKEAYYGHGHVQLVPAYFHLARTNQYMDKFKAAEEFLSLAQWTILRNKDSVDASLKAELHQTFGLLYASDSKLDAALKQLTCATYYLCVMNGPEHILTSFGYFDLGNVFAAKSNMEHAMSFYDKVKEIWYTHLTTALRRALEPESNANSYGVAMDGTDATPVNDLYVASSFGVENLQDAVKMLRGIVGLQTERYGRVHPSTARSEFVLGMFMLWNGDPVSAVASLLKALEISKRVFGPRHPNTGEIRSLMLNFGLEVPEDTTNVLDEDMSEHHHSPPSQITAKAQPQAEVIPQLEAQPDPLPPPGPNEDVSEEAQPAQQQEPTEDSNNETAAAAPAETGNRSESPPAEDAPLVGEEQQDAQDAATNEASPDAAASESTHPENAEGDAEGTSDAKNDEPDQAAVEDGTTPNDALPASSEEPQNAAEEEAPAGQSDVVVENEAQEVPEKGPEEVAEESPASE